MNEAEITRLCAKAMAEDLPHFSGGHFNFEHGGSTSWIERTKFNPLYDDGHAMALVKKFGFSINKNGAIWLVGQPYTENSDLNHTICESVAKVQKVKK